MYRLILLSCLLCCTSGWTQNEMTFRNPKEMADYAFSQTNFNGLGNAFLINRTMELDPNDYAEFLAGSTAFVKGEHNIGLYSLLEWWDMNGSFKRDTILFPVYDHFYTMDEVRELHVPLFVTDMNVLKLKPNVWENFTSSTSTDPFPSITPDDVLTQHLETVSIFLDSFAYNNVYVKFDESTVISNTGKTVDQIILRSNGYEKVLTSGVPVSLMDWLSDRTVEIEVQFTDGSSFTRQQEVEWSTRSVEPSEKDLEEGWLDGTLVMREYVDPSKNPTTFNPEAKFSILYHCDDKKLRKPYLMVTGWGTHTDNHSINEAREWPTPSYKLVRQYNQDGLIEQLSSQGFDIVFISFYPPNASVVSNSIALEKVINRVNEMKMANGSYEENIIMGQSAGALAVKLALQRMEKNHLVYNGPHPHTKLFVSYDGENQGANIPLGAQHAVRYMWDFECNGVPFDNTIYAMHYVLNAPLSKELLHYHYSATGSGANPGQGAHELREDYLANHVTYNHPMNMHLRGYPSFQRNISISNGSSTPDYDFVNNLCDHEPYPAEFGSIFFKQWGSMLGWRNRRFEATFLKPGVHRVFYYEYKPLFASWRVRYEATTNDPLLLDNAPGGIVFISENPIRVINERMRTELTGSPDITAEPLFSFTPTVFTHDIKNLSAYTQNGYLNYDFKVNGLLYENEDAAATLDPNNASNFFGYPHLGHPSDHYSVTPFDAVFTWNQNTEHLIGNRKKADAYEGVYSEVRPVIKNFIADEAEAWNIILQNKRIGRYARTGYSYRVDYEAQNGIYMGEHITQKTDFVEMRSEKNAIVEAQAGTEIVFYPGSHLVLGTTFHAFIGDINCEKNMLSGSHGYDPEHNSNESSVLLKSIMKIDPVVYPNPNRGTFFVDWNGMDKGSTIQLAIFDMTGKKVYASEGIIGSEVYHGLQKGVYVLNIQNSNSCFSTRIIVE